MIIAYFPKIYINLKRALRGCRWECLKPWCMPPEYLRCFLKNGLLTSPWWGQPCHPCSPGWVSGTPDVCWHEALRIPDPHRFRQDPCPCNWQWVVVICALGFVGELLLLQQGTDPAISRNLCFLRLFVFYLPVDYFFTYWLHLLLPLSDLSAPWCTDFIIFSAMSASPAFHR